MPFPPGIPAGGMPAPPGPFMADGAQNAQPGDILHTNSVRVLPKRLAAQFPLFKPGQILISLRSPNVVAVVDPQTRRVVWAAKGVWRSQHDAEFLDDGRLLLFDNLGSSRGSRVLEYDPVTQAIPWAYSGETTTGFTFFRGASQRLPNGNTLVVHPGRCQVVEVNKDKEVVWHWGCPQPPAPSSSAPPPDATDALNFTGARRYSPDQVPFVKEAPRGAPK
jgi:hypothetical protein